jgi:hypothetical protein
MAMQLPLEALAALGEHLHLPRDQLVEVRTLDSVEVAIDNEPTARKTEEVQERASRSNVTPLGKGSETRSRTCAS